MLITLSDIWASWLQCKRVAWSVFVSGFKKRTKARWVDRAESTPSEAWMQLFLQLVLPSRPTVKLRVMDNPCVETWLFWQGWVKGMGGEQPVWSRSRIQQHHELQLYSCNAVSTAKAALCYQSTVAQPCIWVGTDKGLVVQTGWCGCIASPGPAGWSGRCG